MWYRPVRERPPAEVLALAGDELAETGHQELAFASLSTTDYSCLHEVLTGVAAAHPEVRLSLPSLRVDTASVRLAWLASPTGGSLTLAPEAGSQRMRDIINKNVTENDVLTAAEEAFRTGRTTLKLYFMIGLPWETDDDVLAIADLCLKVRQAGRDILAGRAGRLQLNVSVNTFIPKAFTPFQWAAMADRETLRRRQGLLRARLRQAGHPSRHVGPEQELSGGRAGARRRADGRGDRGRLEERGPVRFLDGAVPGRRLGRGVRRKPGQSAEALATAPLAERRGALPGTWSTGCPTATSCGPSGRRLRVARLTGDCRWDGCGICGACEDPPGNELASRAALVGSESARGQRGRQPGEARRSRRLGATSPTSRSPAGAAFSGHLDRMEAFRRAVRRAGGSLALSAGMRPKPLLSLALPLGVGIEGLDELCEFELAAEPAEGFAERLAAALPGHMRLLDLRPYEAARRLAARVTGASYQVVFSASARDECADGSSGDGRAAECRRSVAKGRGVSPRRRNG